MKMFVKKLCRVISVVLCMFLLLSTLIGCGTKATVNIDFKTTLKDAAIYDLDDAAKNGMYKASAEDMAYLATMEKKLSNDYLELYIGSLYDIAILDKETGSVYFSNRALKEGTANATLNDAAKAVAYSQVSLVYYDTANKKTTFTSYPDCVNGDKNQVTMKVQGDKLKLVYEFGEKEEDRAILTAVTVKTFDELDKKAEKLIDKGDLDEFAYTRFKEAYSKIVYDELGSMTQKVYENKYPDFKKLGEIYVLNDGVSTAVLNNITDVSKALGINKSFIEKEKKNYGGEKSNQISRPHFVIPVEYSLQGRDFLASVDTAKITSAKGYYVTKISLLSQFGATTAQENGYTFVPDRSGAIINNDIDAPNIRSKDYPFYGSDFGKEIINIEKVDAYAPLPVFGAYDGTKSVFGIVESGDAIGGVTATVPTDELPYNTVSPWFNYYTQDYQNVYAIDAEKANSDTLIGTSYVYMKDTPTYGYRVRYHFLYGDKALYSGMASYYQKYLLKTKSLSKTVENKNLLLDLNIIGAITKKQLRFGVPTFNVIAASKFSDVEKLTERLHDNSVVNMNLIYTGSMNGGLNFKIPSKAQFEKALGGQEGFEKLYKSINSNKLNLLPSIDFSRVYAEGNGLDTDTQISRYINQKVSYYSGFRQADLSKNDERKAFLINPFSYSDIIEKFISSDSNIKTKTLHISSVASYLSGNYNDKYNIDREEAKYLTVKALEKLSTAGYNMTFDGCNAYTLKYASTISGIPTSSGNYNIESYSVPFVAMVLHGYVNYSGPQLNQQPNYQKALLETIESGAGLNYILMTENPLLLQDTVYSDFYSVSAKEWEDEIVESYKKLNEIFGDLGDCTITKHTRVADGVFATEYSNGTKIYVNYNQTDATVEEGTVESMNYKVVQNGSGV